MAVAGGMALGLALRERSRERAAIDLRGKVVLITGGSRGLGLALAREFAGEGARLALCARDGAELARAREDLERRGAQVFTAVCDVGQRGAGEQLVAEVTRHLGGIDILVNNAGIIQVGPVQSMTVADFEAAMAVNFWGMVHATLAVLPQMQGRRNGCIVNITSIGGKVSVPRLLPYGASKFAAVGFSEGLRTEVASHGIRVVTVAPGLMRTGSYLQALVKGDVDREARWFTLGATLPLVSMDATRAARQIVRAARRGDTERILSLPAAILARVHGLAPAFTVELLTVINRALLPPPTDTAGGPVRAIEVEGRWPVWFIALTTLGRRAAVALHQRSAATNQVASRRPA